MANDLSDDPDCAPVRHRDLARRPLRFVPTQKKVSLIGTTIFRVQNVQTTEL
jgi:hypothetical protein